MTDFDNVRKAAIEALQELDLRNWILNDVQADPQSDKCYIHFRVNDERFEVINLEPLCEKENLYSAIV